MIEYKRILVATLSFLLTASIYSNPVLNNATPNVTIQQTAESTVVTQSSQQAILNWQSFNIGTNESTHFQQPTGGIALNRINPSQGASQIYGQLSATGQIILSNPAGIYFGPSSFVNVGGLIATTSNINDQDFLNKNYKFSNVPSYSGSIINEGQIIAANYGLISLVGNGVDNRGLIQANLGKVIIASGEAFTMNFAGDQLINFGIDQKTQTAGVDKDGHRLSNGVSNSGVLLANGGSILVTAQAAQGILDNVINLHGVVQAQSVAQQNGQIIISGDTNEGVVNVAASIDASGLGNNSRGGTVDITGYNILLAAPTTINVSGNSGGGIINIGGNYHGAGPLPNANATVIAPQVMLNADAIANGDAGNIVIWSDYYTSAHGVLSAQGIQRGGFLETSSKGVLDIAGLSVNLNGEVTGTWLLDPYNVTISASPTSNGSFNSGSPNTFTPSATGSNVLTTDIQTNLATANVIIRTSGGGGAEAGDITLSNAINWASSNSLSLIADHDINLNADITGTGTGGLNFTATHFINLNTPNMISGGNQVYNAAAVTLLQTASVKTTGTGTNISVNAPITNASPQQLTLWGSGTNNNINVQAAGTSSNFLGQVNYISSGTGTTTINGPQYLSLLLTQGNTTLKSDVTSSNYQLYFDPVILGADVNLFSYSSIGFQSTLDGAYNLNAGSYGGGNTNLNFSTVGSITPLTSITANLASTNPHGSITTTGAQIYNSAIDLSNNVVMTGSSVAINAGTNDVLIRNSSSLNIVAHTISLTGNVHFAGGGPLDFTGTGSNASLTYIDTSNTPYTVTISGANSGSYTDSFGFNSTFGSFSNIANITLGTADGQGFAPNLNTFVVSTGGSISGTIDGGPNVGNILHGADHTTSWNITGASAGNSTDVGHFTRIDQVIGGSGDDTFTINGGSLPTNLNGGLGNNTLVGGSTANTWNISGTNAGTTTGLSAGFSNIQNLTGGNANNTFIFADGATLSGLINGGSLAHTNTLDFTAYSSSVKTYLTTNDFTGYVNNSTNSLITNFANITNEMNNSSNSNTLNLANASHTLLISGAKSGNVSGPFNFSGMDTFISTSGSDTLQFSTPYTFNTAAQTAVVGNSTLKFINFHYTPPAPPSPSPVTPISIATINQVVASGQSSSPQQTTTTSSPMIVTTIVQNNVTEIVKQAADVFDTKISNVKINPYCGGV